ncbi:MAG: hypothetical protein GXP37_11320 [Chloroflexi bacterium]|nr:hypothetical protein [Chloroflexota bacterium]
MSPSALRFPQIPDATFKVFHELMPHKVRDVLLVSTPYDAWMLEEDGRLSERIVNEYRGLNLSRPPRLTWVASAEKALAMLAQRPYDMVITMPRLADMDAYMLGTEIKKIKADMPVIVLSHGLAPLDIDFSTSQRPRGIDRHFVWFGNADLLLALVKNTEDQWNVENDTEAARVRVILFVENSPIHLSILLPLLYKELVSQTRAVLEGTLNEEHRLLTMRARPKILLAENYERAWQLFTQFEPYVLGVISDVEFSRKGVLDKRAGIKLLQAVRKQRFDIPLLLTSSNSRNVVSAQRLQAAFVDKTSPSLREDLHSFFKYSLAFGDFIFRVPDGAEVGRAWDLRSLERALRTVPDKSILYHGSRNDFSRWLFTRTETVLATYMRDIVIADYVEVSALRHHMITVLHAHRRERQRGIVADFDARDIDPVIRFYKLGKGSLGGKGRGLAFLSWLLRQRQDLRQKYGAVRLFVPRTLVISTEIFEDFVAQNHLHYLAEEDLPDQEIASRFIHGVFPKGVTSDLRAYLAQIRYPLAVRSSSLLEDAQFRAYAGLYRTYMLPNEHTSLERRLHHLLHAIRLVYASTYFQSPKAFSQRVGRRTEEEQMAVILQQLMGEQHGDYFYPVLSGVAQSYNYYPFAQVKPEDGLATIAVGLGRAVVEGEQTLRFSPRHPQVLPQRSSVDLILENAQRYFYALRMGIDAHDLDISDRENLIRRQIVDAGDEAPIQRVISTYIPDEHRIRDTSAATGYPVVTFASILKYKQFPLAELLTDILAMGSESMGAPVEIEFSVNMRQNPKCKPDFAFLQMRPMTARAELGVVDITYEDIQKAICYATKALGNGINNEISDIVYVKPEAFRRQQSQSVAAEISHFNALLLQQKRKYILIGPGRWGTADRWLGIPVRWHDISGVGAVIETPLDDLNVEPSHGSHFFHNLITLGISYITVSTKAPDHLQWEWLTAQPIHSETPHVAHVQLPRPLTLKVDGRTSTSVIVVP